MLHALRGVYDRALSCEVRDSSTGWNFSWYKIVPYRHGLTQIRDSAGYLMYNVELLSDSSRGPGGSYTLSSAALNNTGVYLCRAERGEPAYHTQYSNPQPLWITGLSPPVYLTVIPSRSQHFTTDSLSLICEEQSNSTGWRVRRYSLSESKVSDCSSGLELVTGSTCNISYLYTSHTGVYWCESESAGSSSPVNITVHSESIYIYILYIYIYNIYIYYIYILYIYIYIYVCVFTY
uniref:Ig-like domain-containing protein n=1 Tax=Astyanax mexicanus TaxID=7994 RepID=A0A3B1KC50_ASTMX